MMVVDTHSRNYLVLTPLFKYRHNSLGVRQGLSVTHLEFIHGVVKKRDTHNRRRRRFKYWYTRDDRIVTGDIAAMLTRVAGERRLVLRMPFSFASTHAEFSHTCSPSLVDKYIAFSLCAMNVSAGGPLLGCSGQTDNTPSTWAHCTSEARYN